MTWELARMLAPEARSMALLLALLSFVILMVVLVLPGMLMLPLFGAAALVGAERLGVHRGLYVLAILAILVGCHTMELLREEPGLAWLLWVICVVVVSDIAGYFAGKSFGGPKFWPSISPKKTWSGTLAGWAGAAVVGIIFASATGAGPGQEDRAGGRLGEVPCVWAGGCAYAAAGVRVGRAHAPCIRVPRAARASVRRGGDLQVRV